MSSSWNPKSPHEAGLVGFPKADSILLSDSTQIERLSIREEGVRNAYNTTSNGFGFLRNPGKMHLQKGKFSDDKQAGSDRTQSKNDCVYPHHQISTSRAEMESGIPETPKPFPSCGFELQQTDTTQKFIRESQNLSGGLTNDRSSHPREKPSVTVCQPDRIKENADVKGPRPFLTGGFGFQQSWTVESLLGTELKPKETREPISGICLSTRTNKSSLQGNEKVEKRNEGQTEQSTPSSGPSIPDNFAQKGDNDATLANWRSLGLNDTIQIEAVKEFNNISNWRLYDATIPQFTLVETVEQPENDKGLAASRVFQAPRRKQKTKKATEPVPEKYERNFEKGSMQPIKEDFWYGTEIQRLRRTVRPLKDIFASYEDRKKYRDVKDWSNMPFMVVELVFERGHPYVKCLVHSSAVTRRFLIVPMRLFPNEITPNLGSIWSGSLELVRCQTMHHRIHFLRLHPETLVFVEELCQRRPYLKRPHTCGMQGSNFYSEFLQLWMDMDHITNGDDTELLDGGLGFIQFNRRLLPRLPKDKIKAVGNGWVEPLPGELGLFQDTDHPWLLIEPFVLHEYEDKPKPAIKPKDGSKPERTLEEELEAENEKVSHESQLYFLDYVQRRKELKEIEASMPPEGSPILAYNDHQLRLKCISCFIGIRHREERREKQKIPSMQFFAEVEKHKELNYTKELETKNWKEKVAHQFLVASGHSPKYALARLGRVFADALQVEGVFRQLKKKEPNHLRAIREMLYYCYEIGNINDSDKLPVWLRDFIFPPLPPVEFDKEVPDFFR